MMQKLGTNGRGKSAVATPAEAEEEEDMTPNIHSRCALQVFSLIDNGYGEQRKKVHERKLKWYGHVMIREEHCVGRRAMKMKVQERRMRGRPKRICLDRVKDDIKDKGLSGEEVYDSVTYRQTNSP